MCKFHAYFFIKKYAKLACPLLYSGVPKTQQAVGKSIVSFQTFGYRLFFMKIHLFILSLRETNQIWEIMSECIEHPENAPEYEGLKVNKGIEQPDPMNPNIAARLKNIRRQTLTTDDYVEGILKGNINILSQAITLVESAKPEHQAVAQEVINRCLPSSGDRKSVV